jgi:ankyrin repeat protein
MSGEGNTSSHSVDALLAKLEEFCRSESISEDGLRGIIEQHGCAPNNDPDIRYDFFDEACQNNEVTEGILLILLEYFPNAALQHLSATDGFRWLPLHDIFDNRNVTLGMVQLLIDASPDSLLHENYEGYTPLHHLCFNDNDVDEEVTVKILKLLLEKYPESVQYADEDGYLPLHYAAMSHSLEFCRILVDAYPESVTMTDNYGELPFHFACGGRNIAKVKYLYQLHPESINVADNYGRVIP